MKRTVGAAIMMSLIVSSVAMADSGKGLRELVRDQVKTVQQGYSQDSRRDDRRDDRHDARRDWREDRRDWRDDRRDWRDDRRDWRDDRRDWHDRGHHYGRIRAGEYRRPWGYRSHYWRRGERLPRGYYARPYIVNNYRDCHLHAPPRGAHWVRVNNDAVLAAIATGLILDVVYNRFY
jgi:Ni/Co efflux regulator RcnB